MKTPKDILQINGFNFEDFQLDNEYSADNILDAMQEYAREYTLSFVEWLTRKDSPYAIVYGDEKRFVTRKKDYTIEDVYEIYKQEQKQT